MTTAREQSSDGLDEFEEQRPRLFGIAYRMLGTVTDAEDILQDAWLRWQATERSAVIDPAAFLARVVTNLCLNVLESARAKREVYVGPWLPEPVFTASAVAGSSDALGPLDGAAQRDTVSFALLRVLERLTPPERAAYVLTEAFGYSNREVAELIGTSEANVRQLHSRARQHVAIDRARHVDRVQWRELVDRFIAAARNGDVSGLEAMLAEDAVSRSDGGGIVNAARNPVRGRDRVARYLVGVFEKFTDGLEPHILEINGELAIMATKGDELYGVWFLRAMDGRVEELDLVLNPQKLEFVSSQLSRMGGVAGLS